MKRVCVAVGLTSLLALSSLTGCASGSSSDAALESVLAKIPTRERASVRVCERLAANRLDTFEQALEFVNSGLQELQSSNDPNGMKNALGMALVGAGDAIVTGDTAAYQNAAYNLATVCTDIVSGEYGK